MSTCTSTPEKLPIRRVKGEDTSGLPRTRRSWHAPEFYVERIEETEVKTGTAEGGEFFS